MKHWNGHLRLNLGCGLLAADGWVNIDGSWNARLAKHPSIRRLLSLLNLIGKDKTEIPWSREIFIHDIRKPLPFPDASASAVYASHVLEHLYLEEGKRLLEEAHRVLAPGGVLRLVVPDLHAIVQEYLGERPFGELSGEFASLSAADRMNRRLLLRWPAPAKDRLYRIYEAMEDFHSHKWMYDLNSLAALVRGQGFLEVQDRKCHESRIENIEKVEDPSRIENGAGICVEGVKARIL